MNAISLASKKSLLRQVMAFAGQTLRPLQAASGRLRYLLPIRRRFTGAYDSFEAAIAVASRGSVAGYDNAEVADVAFEQMCQIAPWDYPVLFWLRSLQSEIDTLIDAGGHMGTKYRAFRHLLQFDPSFRWVVYDVPAIVKAGRARAQRDNCSGLEFVDQIADAGHAPLFLGSGLLQYLDRPFPDLLASMPSLPRHIILNKVALRNGTEIVTLERIGPALVPYRIRDEASFIRGVGDLGYRQVDRWMIPTLSRVIDTHPELGTSHSAGFYFRLND